MSQISRLLSEMEDPLQMFPFQEVAGILAKSVDRAKDHLAQRAGGLGVSVKYRSVDEEHKFEVISLLIRAAFILGQAAITQAVAIAKKLHDLAGRPPWLPDSRSLILQTGARIHQGTSLSEIVLFDAVVNYFKHHHEWPLNWNQDRSGGDQCRAIEKVRLLGITPDGDRNLEIVLDNLGFGTTGVTSVGESIQAWREALAQDLRRRLHAPHQP